MVIKITNLHVIKYLPTCRLCLSGSILLVINNMGIPHRKAAETGEGERLRCGKDGSGVSLPEKKQAFGGKKILCIGRKR